MPYDEADETDPMMLVGVELHADAETLLETARVFADEFAQLGFDEERIMSLFRSPMYAGPYNVREKLGEDPIRTIVKEYTAFWGAIRFRERDTDPELGIRVLPTLNKD